MSKARRDQKIEKIKDEAVKTGLELMSAVDMTAEDRLLWAEVTLRSAAAHVALIEEKA
jgi:hypothetical protein